jgi:hypothetical protein
MKKILSPYNVEPPPGSWVEITDTFGRVVATYQIPIKRKKIKKRKKQYAYRKTKTHIA